MKNSKILVRLLALALMLASVLFLSACVDSLFSCGDDYVAPEAPGTKTALSTSHVILSAEMDSEEDDYGTITTLTFSAEAEGHDAYAYLQCQISVTWTCQLMNQSGEYEPFTHTEILTLNSKGEAECDGEVEVRAWGYRDLKIEYAVISGNVSVK